MFSSNYVHAFASSDTIPVVDEKAVQQEVIVLRGMFDCDPFGTMDIEYYDNHIKIISSDEENSSLEPYVGEPKNEWHAHWKALPSDWSEEKKRAHADTFGYLYGWSDWLSAGDDDHFDVIPWLRRHMPPGKAATIVGVTVYDGDPSHYSVRFSREREHWINSTQIENSLMALSDEELGPDRTTIQLTIKY